MRAAGLGLMLGLAPALVGESRAQSSGGAFELSAHATEGGGGRSSCGGVELHGTVGQSGLGALATGGVFELSAGFRRARSVAAPPPDAIFSDGFEQP